MWFLWDMFPFVRRKDCAWERSTHSNRFFLDSQQKLVSYGVWAQDEREVRNKEYSNHFILCVSIVFALQIDTNNHSCHANFYEFLRISWNSWKFDLFAEIRRNSKNLKKSTLTQMVVSRLKRSGKLSWSFFIYKPRVCDIRFDLGLYK